MQQVAVQEARKGSLMVVERALVMVAVREVVKVVQTVEGAVEIEVVSVAAATARRMAAAMARQMAAGMSSPTPHP